MLSFEAFHGTWADRKESILSEGFKPSVCTKEKQHWLGNGVYFFDNEADAIEWVQRYKRSAILCSVINVEENKLFNLIDDHSHYEIFETVADRILKEKDKHNLSIDRDNKIDGYVINFICNNICRLDVIKAGFPFQSSILKEYKKDYGYPVSRLQKIQIQYCVRNTDCITCIKEKVS